MQVLSKSSRVVPFVTTEEAQQRLQDEIRNFRRSISHVRGNEALAFAVMIECREFELASLRRRSAAVAHPIADTRTNAA
jgi:hypothetical protein